MKILVTGAAGMLGSSLCPILRQNGHEVNATDINTADKGIECLDVRNFEQVKTFVEKIDPDLVMHLAAETDVDKCELEPDYAYLTNTIGTQNIALVCQKYDIETVYISTIGVFDGNKPEPYTEFDEPNPINVYGKSKLWGEKVIENLLRKYYIVRAGWMMGGGPGKDKKFVAKIIGLLSKTNRLKVVNDKFGSPTCTVDLSNCLSELIETEYYGLYHCTNKGFASRCEIAKKIVEYLGRNDVTIEPTSSAYFPLPAPRARSEASRNYKLELLGIDNARHWEEALKEYIEKHWMTKYKI
jgi:dTDP-4-dehydrorhamnose reductase